MDATREVRGDVARLALENSRQRSTLMFVAAVTLTLFGVCWSFYGRCCNIGFTLDEFSHIPYIFSAFNGDPRQLLAHFYSTFSDKSVDGMVAYRPIMVASLVLDYVLWGAQPFGWHFDTLLAFFAVCCLSGLVSYELLRPAWSVRSCTFAALLTNLFMIVYPGHPDSVVTIVGRHDCLATAFMLFSLYLYSLSRRSNNKRLIPFSIASFLFGLGSKEIAVTLPLMLMIGEMLGLFEAFEIRNGALSRIKLALQKTQAFWIALVVFACVRTICVHSLVGGYGKIKLIALLEKFQIFGDLDTLKRIVLSINAHFSPPDTLVLFLIGLYSYSIVRLVFKSFQDPHLRRLVVFFLLFAILNVLPAFQIWRIWPNLVGMRLFFVSSVSLAFLLAAALTPKSKRLFANVLDVSCAGGILFTWGVILSNNLIPFQISGSLMQVLRSQITELIYALPKDQRLVLANLPKDYCGAPMLGKSNFLAVNLRPPLSNTDLTSRVLVLEDDKLVDLAGELSDPYKLHAAYIYAWSNELGRFVQVTVPTEHSLLQDPLFRVEMRCFADRSRLGLSPFTQQITLHQGLK